MVTSQSQISINNGNVIACDTILSKGFSVFSVKLLRKISQEIKLGCGVNNLLNKNYNEHLSMNGDKKFKHLSGSSVCEPGRHLMGKC